jgi:outer membrane protein TolC
VAAAENQLAARLHLPAGTRFDVHKMNQHDENDALLKKEFRPDTHRQVQILKAQKDASYNEMKRHNRWWTPAVEVGGGYALYTLREREYPEWRDRREAVIGINVKLQPFDGLQAHSEARAAAQRMKGYEMWADQVSRNLESDYESDRQRLELLHRLLHQGEQGVVQGRTYLDRTLTEYTDGVKNSTDVIVATQKYFDFRKRYVTLRRDYQLARSNLMSLLGE